MLQGLVSLMGVTLGGCQGAFWDHYGRDSSFDEVEFV